jgi:cation diffusion facilitator family transporter
VKVLKKVLGWFGFGDFAHGHSHGAGGHSHGGNEGHGHTHGVMDATIATTARGIWAIKWSFVLLMTTTLMQVVVVYFSGSVALLADTIHNFGDAATAIPLWIAFILVRREPSLRFTYGLGRVEDLAGVVIVGLILLSAIVAGWQSVERLLYPQPISHVWWVFAAGIIGFIGNEAVAVFRIRVGREIDSAALIADGYHARVDGITSLAVVAGAIGVGLGFPLADPIVGMIITLMIFGIVWQSARAVFTRMLDGTEPEVPGEIRHAVEHVAGVRSIDAVRARWLGHRLAVDLDVSVDGTTTVHDADTIMSAIERELLGHLPALGRASIRVRPYQKGKETMTQSREKSHDHDHPHPHDDKGGHGHDHSHPHPHDHDHPHPHPHDDKGGHGHDHPHPHDDEHDHDHKHDHRH